MLTTVVLTAGCFRSERGGAATDLLPKHCMLEVGGGARVAALLECFGGIVGRRVLVPVLTCGGVRERKPPFPCP